MRQFLISNDVDINNLSDIVVNSVIKIMAVVILFIVILPHIIEILLRVVKALKSYFDRK